MKSKPTNLAPVWITILALLFSIFLHALSRNLAERPDDPSGRRNEIGLTERLEALTYDFRVRLAASMNDAGSIAKNMATLFFDDVALQQVGSGDLSYYYAPTTDQASADALSRLGWPWPRFIHGQVVRELSAEGATAVGFDIMFPLLLPERPQENVPLPEGGFVTSDEFFALQMNKAKNVHLAVEQEDTMPADLFRTNSAGLVSIVSKSDFAVLRRVKPFELVRVWHPILRSQVKALNLDLPRAVAKKGKVVIPRRSAQEAEEADTTPVEVPLNANGSMQMTSDGDIDYSNAEPGKGVQTEFAFTEKRVWNLGLTLAAKSIGLDLEHPEFRPGKVILRGTNGLVRTIPVDGSGYFYVDWSIRLEELKKGETPVYFGRLQRVLNDDKFRAQGEPNDLMPFKNRIVIIGSIASGNNMTDFGATPLDSRTPLVTKHLNIANSILTGRFIERTSLFTELVLIVILGLITALLTWRMRLFIAAIAVLGLALVFTSFCISMYVQHRYWIPMVMPLGGGFFLPFFSLVTYRMVFEQREQRRVRGIFSKIVSPDVVHELLSAEKLAALSGARRTITVFFADVRGFTEFTDSTQQAAEEYVQKNNLSGEQSRAFYDQIAAEQLRTVNLYLATIADTIKNHRGTLDKYMGDCVMAFWGAPTPNEEHAVCCVRAAIDAQRALYALNQERIIENERRKKENVARGERNELPLGLLPVLSLGTGINTGSATVGLMGSDATILNYTVFGREVNLASRLEGASGRGRILISETTLHELQRRDPTLAASCIVQMPITPKGFRQAIRVYEVPWRTTPVSGSELPSVAPEPLTTTKA